MATLADIKTRVRQHVYGQYPTDSPFATTLNAAIASGAVTTVTVIDGTDWMEGDILEVLETEEQMQVVSVATHVLTVVRGVNGTTAAAATDGGIVYKNPRMTYAKIGQAITDTLYALQAWGIHAFGTGSITKDSLKHYYELSETDILPEYGILNLYYVEQNTEIPVPLPFRQAFGNLGTGPSEYSTGLGVHVLDWGDVTTGDAAYFVYAKQVDSVTDLTTPQELIVVLGATALLLGMTITPATQDPGARTDRTVQPGQTSRDARWYQGEFFIRSRAEAASVAVQRSRFPSTVRLSRSRRWKP